MFFNQKLNQVKRSSEVRCEFYRLIGLFLFSSFFLSTWSETVETHTQNQELIPEIDQCGAAL